MKRNQSLVSYGSSDEDEVGDFDGKDAAGSSAVAQANQVTTTTSSGLPPLKRLKKLPTLSPDLVPPPPPTDPSKHEGRIRTTPHVDGQFAAYVYVPVALDTHPRLAALLGDAVSTAREIVPSLRSDLFPPRTGEKGQSVPRGGGLGHLHVSLTHPIYLRHHQRDELKRAVKGAAQVLHPFTASFVTFATFENDERTRAFLGVEVGAGHDGFASLSGALSESLLSLRQKLFYDAPRFHASIAWALLEHPKQFSSADNSSVPLNDVSPPKSAQFPTITSFPTSLLPAVTSQHGSVLAGTVGTFEIDEICAKIGKDVFRWTLGARQ